MLPEFETYVPNQTYPLARDMNTAGQVVRIINNISGANAFVDSTGVHFRRQIAAAAVDLPAGQYDGMVLQTTSQLTLGAGYLRIVNTPPT